MCFAGAVGHLGRWWIGEGAVLDLKSVGIVLGADRIRDLEIWGR